MRYIFYRKMLEGIAFANFIRSCNSSNYIAFIWKYIKTINDHMKPIFFKWHVFFEWKIVKDITYIWFNIKWNNSRYL